jgi:hypothetical protein
LHSPELGNPEKADVKVLVIDQIEETVANPDFGKPHWFEVWRRRHAEAEGRPYQPLPEVRGGRCVNWAEAWRARRALSASNGK